MKNLRATKLPRQLAIRFVVSAARLSQPLFWLTALFSALVMSGCVSGEAPDTASAPQTASVRLVDPDAFATAILEPSRVTINVHVPFEGNIEGTDLSVPFDQLASQSDRLPADRRTPLAVYCRSGPMSAVAINVLRDLGYTDLVELRGGMRAWHADGRQLMGL
jgi:rhodanese-related sulfurtransferase